MRLKKLEINGFKSFPEGTVIDFPSGILSIVGPNGCGKSNIFDAIKWVMGEQSALQLRGKAMDDLIFSGTNEQSQLNMAEVTLTLANDNGSAPEELKHLSEIAITRRLHRSGDRSYFINKQPCRLKDIYNIFLGSGMGARSYAIIQQGNIGAVTEATPEERRSFIEEAAGVTRYKTRKTETLRKIKATNQDLLRIKDILAEITQRMNSLNRQAKKAQRYKNYKEAIKELDILLSLTRYDDYSRQMSETDALLSSLKDIDNQHASEISQLDAAIEAIKFEKEKKDREINDRKESTFSLQRKIDKTENDLAHIKNEAERLQAEISALKEEKSLLEQRTDKITKEIEDAEESNSSLTEKYESIKESLSHRQEEAKQFLQRQDQLKQQLDQQKNELMRMSADEAKYQNTCQNASENKESLLKRKQEIRNERTNAARNATRLKNNRDKTQQDIADLKQRLEEQDQAVEKIEQKLEAKRESLTVQFRQVQQAEMERNSVKSKYNEIKRLNDSFEWFKDGVKAVLTRAASGEDGSGAGTPANILGVAADFVKPEAGYETATEAVLGESLQYILVENQQAGAAWIEDLRENQSGRGGFIPVSLFTDQTGALSEHGPEFKPDQDLLINHISVSPGYEAVIESLLGHVILAGNLNEALRLWQQPNGGTPATIVTREGDLITAGGIITGGSKDRLAGILAKKQELKELEGRIQEITDTLANARQEQSRLETDVRELEEDLQQTRNNRNQTTARKTELEMELSRISEELKYAENRLEIMELEEQNLDGEESDLDDEINQYQAALEAVQQKIAEINQQIESTNQQQREAADDWEEFNQTTMELRLQLTSSEAALENNSKTLERLKSFLDDTTDRLNQVLTDLDSKEDKLAVDRETIVQQESSLQNDFAALKRREEDLSEIESEYTRITEEIAASDRKSADIRSRREENAEKIRYVEREQSERGLKQENIRQRLEDRYHASFDSIRQKYAQALADNEKSAKEMDQELADLRQKLDNIGDVNLAAIEEYEEQKERREFLESQHDDLVEAIDDLHKVINKINNVSQKRFLETFRAINEKMNEVFPRLFEGGTAELVLTEPDKPLETGVELMVHPPGKKLTRLSLLSGGEKALSAIAFIFSIFLLKPTSFCLMDEIDAPLDEANIFRFNELLKIIGEQSQIVMVTHNKKTMEFADRLLGVTMEKKGISKLVTVDLARGNGHKPQLISAN